MFTQENTWFIRQPLQTLPIRLRVLVNGGATEHLLTLPTLNAGDTLRLNLEQRQQDGTWNYFGPLLNANFGDDLLQSSCPPSPSPAPAGSPDQKPRDSCGLPEGSSISEDSFCSDSIPAADRRTSSGSSGHRSIWIPASCPVGLSVSERRRRNARLRCDWDDGYCHTCGGGDEWLPAST